MLRIFFSLIALITFISCSAGTQNSTSQKINWSELNAKYPRFTHARCEPVLVDTTKPISPFSPVLPPRFILPSDGFATVLITDSDGQEVDTLVSRQLDAGVYELPCYKPPASISGFIVAKLNGQVVSKERALVLK